MSVSNRLQPVPGLLVLFLVIGLATSLARPTFAQSSEWAELARSGSAQTDAELARAVEMLSLGDALAVARALTRRPEPDVSAFVRELQSRPTGPRQELVLRTLAEGWLSLEPSVREHALSENGTALRLVLAHAERWTSPMLWAAFWHAAAQAPADLRRSLLPEARQGASLLAREFSHAAQEAGPPKVTDPELNAAASGFAAFVRATGDPGLTALADRMREQSGHAATVRRLRSAVRTASRSR
jgi:hypothetical protein